jgi:hypothetical protein
MAPELLPSEFLDGHHWAAPSPLPGWGHVGGEGSPWLQSLSPAEDKDGHKRSERASGSGHGR